MVNKETLHLGQKVTYNEGEAVVDALLQNSVGLLVGGRTVITSYDNVYAGL